MTLVDRILRRDPDPLGLGEVELLWLGEPAAGDPTRTGGKAANLSRLAAGWPVPPGFCLPAAMHRRVGDPATERAACLRSLCEVVRPAYRRLGRGPLARTPVAVRSSAPDEDAAEASFAGQHETVLDASGARAVARSVLACWESARSSSALEYREAHGLTAEASMAVLVQELVDADVSGVAFSANPITGVRDQVMVNASFGLGASVVDGVVTPDTYLVSHTPLAVRDRTIATKDVAVVRGRGGPQQVEVAPERRRRPALDDAACREVARMTIDLAHEMGWPADVEFAFRDGELFLLQCRPITTLAAS